ncbi:hypothetical protein YC2023_047793 [Brassica napus]
MADGGPPTGVGGEPGVSWPRDTALDRWTVLKEGGNLNLAAGNNYSRDSHPGEKSHERETPIEFLPYVDIALLPYVDPARPRFKTDQQPEWRGRPEEDRGILHSVPEGLRKVLNYIKDKYNNPTVYIKENGINDYDDGRKSRGDILNDTFRIKYHEDHLQQLYKAIIEDGCDVRGYYAWSLLDNFEWEHGYNTRFGLYYVDYDNNLERYPKDSVNWFKRFLNRLDVKSEEIKKEEVWDVSRNNETLDNDAKGFEASVRSIIYLMTNSSRREESLHFGVSL